MCNWGGGPYRRGPKKRGRTPHLKRNELLGLALWYIKTNASAFCLYSIFGILPNLLCVWLEYSFEVLLGVVKKKPKIEFEIRWFINKEIHASFTLLHNSRTFGPLLDGIFAVTEGRRRPCASYIENILQNEYFEGFKQGVAVTKLFV